MKPLPKNILIGVLIVVGIAGLFVLGALFGGRKNSDHKYFDLLIAEKDKQIQQQQEYRKQTVELYGRLLEDSRRLDSMLAERSKINTIRREKVPVIVNAMSDPELVRAIESEFGQ